MLFLQDLGQQVEATLTCTHTQNHLLRQSRDSFDVFSIAAAVVVAVGRND